MTKIKKQDQIIIQKKIDGHLLPGEDDYFKVLMESSPEAREYYRGISLVDKTLKFNVKHIPEMDFAGEIMEKVDSDKERDKTHIKNLPLFSSGKNRQILAYAAILLIGLILGSAVTYFGTTNSGTQNEQKISGTLAGSSGNEFSYSNSGTEINIRRVGSGNYLALIVKVATRDTVYFSFRSESQNNSVPEIQTLYSEDQSPIINQDGGYLFQERNIFLISNADRLIPGSINFRRSGKLICNYNIRQD